MNINIKSALRTGYDAIVNVLWVVPTALVPIVCKYAVVSFHRNDEMEVYSYHMTRKGADQYLAWLWKLNAKHFPSNKYLGIVNTRNKRVLTTTAE